MSSLSEGLPPEPKQPERRHRLKVTFDADSILELERALIEFARHIACGRMSSDGVSGGLSHSWVYQHVENPDQTPEGYQAELERWWEWDRERVRREREME